MGDSTGSGDYWDNDKGGGRIHRTYRDGTSEWRQDRGGGWWKVQDNKGNTVWEREHGHDRSYRSDKGWGKTSGGWTRWDDGSYTRDNSSGGK